VQAIIDVSKCFLVLGAGIVSRTY